MPPPHTMTESEIYFFQPEQHPAHTYELDATGLIYRPPGRESVAVRWERIAYLKDVSGQRVDIVAADSPRRIPLFYATRHFAELLARVCNRLADLHREQIGVQTFSGHRSYLLHIGSVLALFALLIVFSTVYLHHFVVAWLFILATAIPMAVYLLRQPHTVTPGDDYLEVKDFIRTRIIDYARIQGLVFGLHGDQYTAYLCVKLQTADGRQIKIQRFENLLLLYIFLKIKWDAARRQGGDGRLRAVDPAATS
jgi:hypothetical protein